MTQSLTIRRYHQGFEVYQDNGFIGSISRDSDTWTAQTAPFLPHKRSTHTTRKEAVDAIVRYAAEGRAQLQKEKEAYELRKYGRILSTN